MARPNAILIEAIRNTVRRLEKSTSYQWGHMGSCNCGHLAQELTRLSKKEIHSRAMQKHGDWTEQLNDYCPASGLLMDDLITHMLSFGLDTADLQHLETLSDPLILRRVPGYEKGLAHNLKQDVIRYMKAWINLLEEKLAAKVTLHDLQKQAQPV
jgi:hypothetical protein